MNSTSSSAMPNTIPTTSVMLPEIRTMSPLQVPAPSQPDSSVTASSHETFTTAFSSTPSPSSPVVSPLQSMVSTRDHSSAVSPAALLPPHSLRKSISVDSFISSRRHPDSSDAGPSSPVQQRDHSRDTKTVRPRELNDIPDKNTLDPSSRIPPFTKSLTSRLFGRTRGHSLSGPSVEYDDPYLDDSEHEHVSDLVQLPMLSSQRTQTAPMLPNGLSRGQSRSRLNNHDGLLLPPRSSLSTTTPTPLPPTSTTPTISPSTPSVVASHSRRPVPNPLVLPSNRQSSSSVKRNRATTESKEALSIGVVGTFGCGKTTMIRRGLRVWGVSDESVSTIPTPKGRIRFGIRTINASREDDITATVVEVDSDNFSYDTPEGAWPEGLPHIDGVLVLYDASDPASYIHVPELIVAYHSLQLPVIVVACKCDLEIRVLPDTASDRAKPYGIGLVEVSIETETGRLKMRYCFKWLLRSIEQAKRGDVPTGPDYPNPASPDVLSAPWSEGHYGRESRSSFTRSMMGTPTNGSPSTAMKSLNSAQVEPSPTISNSASTPRPHGATSPTRVKSVGDLMTEVEKNRQEEREVTRHDSQDGRPSSLSRSVTLNGETRSGSLNRSAIVATSKGASDQAVPVEKTKESGERTGSHESKAESRNNGKKEAPSMPWATLEELLDKLFFLAVSGDDPTFIKHFLLTYRKFATPRTVLLGMQKRVRQLTKDYSDLLLGNYAQMRICDLLVEWISTYPTDFATPGSHGALKALVKHISSNPCTLHYGSDLLPFLDELPRLKDLESSWALPCEDPTASDESDAAHEELEPAPIYQNVSEETFASSAVTSSGKDSSPTQSKLTKSTTRERKASLPLSTKSLTSPIGGDNHRLSASKAPPIPPRNSLRDLNRLLQSVNTYDAEDFAQQITKMQRDLFLAIEPRQWLRYAMSETRSQNDPISICANFYNHLAFWVSSLILVHERIKAREKQVERFVDLAQRLRYLNNYVGLRAVMTGINNATYPNDEIMSTFRYNKIRLYQQYLGWEILLSSQHNHRAYRMALRNTDGPAIPDMEVHTFDMVRANDSNPNYKSDDPNKIHWGKFTLMARMILMLQGLQEKIRGSRHLDFPERQWIRDMIENDVMDPETIQSRVYPPRDDAEPPVPWTVGPESPSTSKNESARFRKMFFNRLK